MSPARSEYKQQLREGILGGAERWLDSCRRPKRRRRPRRDALNSFAVCWCGLEAEFTVRRLPAALPVLAVGLGFEFSGGSRAVLVNVAAGKAGAVRAVPVLFEKH